MPITSAISFFPQIKILRGLKLMPWFPLLHVRRNKRNAVSNEYLIVVPLSTVQLRTHALSATASPGHCILIHRKESTGGTTLQDAY